MEVPPRRLRVTVQELRRRFNEGDYWQRAKSGQLREHVLRSQPCHVPTEPPGTLSQIVAYYDGVEKIAVVHQYLRPDGTVGASGRPDPKRLLDEGAIYIVESD